MDLALDEEKLSGERYAELIQSLLKTRRYRKGALVEFHDSPDDETRSRQARRAYELTQKLLSLL